MAHEGPQFEQDRLRETQVFKVETLSDHQILLLYRGLSTVGIPDDAADKALDGLYRQLIADVQGLGSRDPGRLKNLVDHCEQSYNGYDQELGAEVAPGLMEYDYEFVRDTLVSLAASEAMDATRFVISDLMRDRLTPDQIADFNTRLAVHGDEYRCDPSLPEQI